MCTKYPGNPNSTHFDVDIFQGENETARSGRIFPDVGYIGYGSISAMTLSASGSSEKGTRYAGFKNPLDVDVDQSGTFAIVADCGNHVLRKIDLAGGATQTIAGKMGEPGARNGIVYESRLRCPCGISMWKSKFALFIERGNFAIRKVTIFDDGKYEISTLAGSMNTSGHVDGANFDSRFASLTAIAIHPSGRFAVVAGGNHGTLRKVFLDQMQRTITLSSNIHLLQPSSIVFENNFSSLIVDQKANKIYRAQFRNASIQLMIVAGTDSEGSRDGPGMLAKFQSPAGLALFAGNTHAVIVETNAVNSTARILSFLENAQANGRAMSIISTENAAGDKESSFIDIDGMGHYIGGQFNFPSLAKERESKLGIRAYRICWGSGQRSKLTTQGAECLGEIPVRAEEPGRKNAFLIQNGTQLPKDATHLVVFRCSSGATSANNVRKPWKNEEKSLLLWR